MKVEITSDIDKCLSPLVCAYRKSYNTQHVIRRMVEDWKEKIDQYFYATLFLTDLSKVLESIIHDLLIAKRAT